MERKDLKIFTKISFFTALVTIIALSPFIFISPRISNEETGFILRFFGYFSVIAYYASLFGIPLSIVSMFSKENLAKRIFALIINLLPTSFLVYFLVLEYMD